MPSRSKNTPLYAHEAGVGDAVVLIPGLGGLGSFWHPLQAALGTRFRTLAVDHPGMGRSAKCGPPSIQDIAARVLELLDRLEIACAHVIGHSTGGLVAQALALDAPHRVKKMVLSSTWGRPDRRFRDLFRLRQHVLREAGPAAYAALGELLAYPAGWYEQHLASPATPDFGRAMAIDPAWTLARIDMLLDHDRFDELDHIQAPVLVVGAHDDHIVTFNHAQQLAARVPSARLVELSGGHFTPVTRTPAYAQMVSTFLGGEE